LDGRPDNARPVEEQIMDWADEVTYACHDVEDFYRAGLIPLDLVLALRGDSRSRSRIVESYDTQRFLDYVDAKRARDGKPFNRDTALELLDEISNLCMVYGPYYGLHSDKVLVTSMTSRLISYFLTGLALQPATAEGDPLVRYGANLSVTAAKKEACGLLKELIWFYVIDRPELASQQHGQSRMMSDLLEWHAAEPTRLLPEDRKEEAAVTGSTLRAACDHIASLTEPQAMSLYHRMTGIAPGAITDRFH
jgi:dGTPase